MSDSASGQGGGHYPPGRAPRGKKRNRRRGKGGQAPRQDQHNAANTQAAANKAPDQTCMAEQIPKISHDMDIPDNQPQNINKKQPPMSSPEDQILVGAAAPDPLHVHQSSIQPVEIVGDDIKQYSISHHTPTTLPEQKQFPVNTGTAITF